MFRLVTNLEASSLDRPLNHIVQTVPPPPQPGRVQLLNGYPVILVSTNDPIRRGANANPLLPFQFVLPLNTVERPTTILPTAPLFDRPRCAVQMRLFQHLLKSRSVNRSCELIIIDLDRSNSREISRKTQEESPDRIESNHPIFPRCSSILDIPMLRN